MAATTISRATWTDGAGTGTVISNARLQADVYDKVDALIGANIIFGGTISAEGFGTHSLSAGAAGLNMLLVRNSSAGTTNMGRVAAQGDAASPAFISLDMASSTFVTTGGLVANGGRLFCGGTAGLAIETNASSGIRTYSAGILRATIDSNGVIVENNHALYLKNSGGNGIVGFTVNGSNAMSIGSDNASSVGELTLSAGGAIRFRANSAERMVMTAGGLLQVANGSASGPSLAFLSDTDTGFYRTTGVGLSIDGTLRFDFEAPTSPSGQGPALRLASGAYGTSATGSQITVGRNSSGSGAGGSINFEQRDAGAGWVWCDGTGVLRIGPSPPVEDGGSASDTTGTIVGTQTSSRDAKDVLGLFIDRPSALRTVLDTPLFRWRYKKGRGIQGEDFMSIITDDSPAFGMDRDAAHPGGKSLNVANAVGLLVASVQELQLQINALRKAT